MKKIWKISAFLLALPVLASCKPGFKGKGESKSEDAFLEALDKAAESCEYYKEEKARSYVLKSKGSSKTVSTTKRKSKVVNKIKRTSSAKETIKYSKEKMLLSIDSVTRAKSNTKNSDSNESGTGKDKAKLMYQSAQYEGATYLVEADKKDKSYSPVALLSNSVKLEDAIDEAAKDKVINQIEGFELDFAKGYTPSYYINGNVFTIEVKVDAVNDYKPATKVIFTSKTTGTQKYQIDFTNGKISYKSYSDLTFTTEYYESYDGHAKGEVIKTKRTSSVEVSVKAKKVSLSAVKVGSYAPIGFDSGSSAK